MMKRPQYRAIAALLLLLAWVFSCTGALAAPTRHPAPSVLHDYLVKLVPKELSVVSFLRISPELAPEVYRKIDLNNDGQTSDAERANWVQEHAARLKMTFNGQPQSLEISPAPPLKKEDLLVSIDHPIVITYTAALATPVSGKQRMQVIYGDNYLSYDEYYLSVEGDTSNDSRPQPITSNTYPATYNIVYHMPVQGENMTVGEGQIAAAPWTAGLAQAQQAQTQAQTQVLDNIRDWRGDLWAAMGMLAVAVLLGALHAMTPGHGKTMVASYLVGSQGRVRDAVLLGGVVTFTHTAGIITLGLVLTLVSNASMPRALQPALQLGSGVLVLLLGSYLLITRWRATRAANTLVAAGAQALVPAASVAQGSSLPVRHVTSQVHEHTHDHSHDHDHTHTHSHGGPAHAHAPAGGKVSARELVALGISGGIVPCPDALAILLLSAAVGQYALGVSLVVAFSLGLAAVLIALGITLVKVRGALERSRVSQYARSEIWMRWVPVASAAVVIVIGTAMILASLGSRWG